VRPAWPLRLPGGGMDGVQRRTGSVLARLLHVEEQPAVVRVARLAGGSVLLGAEAERADVAEEAIARMCFALGLDDDLRPFYERFRDDPLIGRSVRARPGLRVRRRPDPFEALAWAICEQLIEYERATAIERRIVWTLGRRCARTGLRDLPSAATLAAVAPARLQALDLGAGRALALRRAAREVAAGRADLRAPDHERAWRRLRAIPGIGRWTIEMLALNGQGRHDQLPAADVGYLKLVGRLQQQSPHGRATEDEVRAFFAPYGEWAGLAGAHALATGSGSAYSSPPAPRRARTRSSAPGWSPAAA
jgi:DNA-3-methyladenine glycosylase II